MRGTQDLHICPEVCLLSICPQAGAMGAVSDSGVAKRTKLMSGGLSSNLGALLCCVVLSESCCHPVPQFSRL